MNDADPFAALGLPALRDVSDDDVRAAWRRIAAATHPDRDDGGDPARFGAAAAAYAMLRTSYGRGEALAELGLAGNARPRGRARGPARGRRGHAGRHARGGTVRPVTAAFVAFGHFRNTRQLRPGLAAGQRAVRANGWRLAVRVVAAGTVGAGAALAAGWTPGTIGVLVGVLTWLAATRQPSA